MSNALLSMCKPNHALSVREIADEKFRSCIKGMLEEMGFEFVSEKKTSIAVSVIVGVPYFT